MTASGKAVLYDLGKGGTERSVTGRRAAQRDDRQCAAVGVTVNGRPVAPPPQPPGQTVARFSVGPDGTLR